MGLQAFGECISQGGHTLVLKSEIYFGALFHNVHFLFFSSFFNEVFFIYLTGKMKERERQEEVCHLPMCHPASRSSQG